MLSGKKIPLLGAGVVLALGGTALPVFNPKSLSLSNLFYSSFFFWGGGANKLHRDKTYNLEGQQVSLEISGSAEVSVKESKTLNSVFVEYKDVTNTLDGAPLLSFSSEEFQAAQVTNRLSSEIIKEVKVQKIESEAQTIYRGEKVKLVGYQKDFEKVEQRVKRSLEAEAQARTRRATRAPTNNRLSQWTEERKALQKFLESYSKLKRDNSSLHFQLLQAISSLSTLSAKGTDNFFDKAVEALKQLSWSSQHVRIYPNPKNEPQCGGKGLKQKKKDLLWGWKDFKTSPFREFFKSQKDWENLMKEIDQKVKVCDSLRGSLATLRGVSNYLSQKEGLRDGIEYAKGDLAVKIAESILKKMKQ